MLCGPEQNTYFNISVITVTAPSPSQLFVNGLMDPLFAPAYQHYEKDESNSNVSIANIGKYEISAARSTYRTFSF